MQDDGVSPDALGILEVAAALGVSPDTVRRRIRAGTLKAQRDGAGKWLVDRDELPEAPRAQPSAADTELDAVRQELSRLQAEETRLRAQAEQLRREADAARRDADVARREATLLRELIEEVRASRDHAYADAADLWFLLGRQQAGPTSGRE